MTATDNTFWFDTFQEHSSSVLAFLTSRVGRRDLAEDLLQETFVRAMRKQAELPDSAKMRSYLFTTAYHLVIDQRRRKRPALFSEVSSGESDTIHDVADPEQASPETAVDVQRLGERLHDALRPLSNAHRTAFELAVLQQKPYAEIATEQGWTVEQVKVNVHRARKKVIGTLRDLLRPHPEIGR
jgi:RNA polymerase sigma-70 factor (ECF subfamily)